MESAKSSAKDKLWGKIQQQQLQDLRFILSYGNNAPQRNWKGCKKEREKIALWTKSCRTLQQVAKSFQKLQETAKCYQKLPKIAINKLP